MSAIPDLRIRAANDAPLRDDGDFVLYWMIAARRSSENFALDRAVALAKELSRPLVILEPLRAGYRWASARHHRFVIDGMAANQRAFADKGVTYVPYVEPAPGDGKGLLEHLAARACVVVTDEFPAFFIPRMIEAAAAALPVRLEVIDSCGIVPLRATERVFPTAYAFRRVLQRTLPRYLDDWPRPRPLFQLEIPTLAESPAQLLGARWAPASDALLGGDAEALAALPIDAKVAPTGLEGGADAANTRMRDFLNEHLRRYGSERSQPTDEVASGLSPYLHFGHISSHRILRTILREAEWTPERLGKPQGKREGWWGLEEGAESFLDELITWREIGFNMASKRRDFDRYASLPEWAQRTLDEHLDDDREHLYTLDEFTRAATHDPLWNAAQRQLLSEGRIHNYLRMLWGKKILEWSKTPKEALDVMIELNNKYALDGRDPNSYSGIFWVLGRYDRAWGPERPVIGVLRPMSSTNTARKLRVKGYLERYGPQAALL
ncbi:MAG: hypothetical protein R3A79_09155 [Nannocystaceae bacterium]